MILDIIYAILTIFSVLFAIGAWQAIIQGPRESEDKPKKGRSTRLPILILLISLTLASCVGYPTKCENPIDGKAVLVAYRVAKHSHIWLKDPRTNIIYDIGGLGGRREPNINLGDTINVQYCNKYMMENQYDLVQEPNDRTTRYISLNGYENLY